MTHNITSPSYQEYPANLLARLEFRGMTLAQRGLLYTLRLECWVNKSLPADPASLARILGLSVAEIEAELPNVIMGFFDKKGSRLFSPCLERYRIRVEGIREKQIASGKTTAKKRWGAKPRHASDSGPIGDLQGDLQDDQVGDLYGVPNRLPSSSPNRSSGRSFSPSLSPSPSPSPNPSPSQQGIVTTELGIGDTPFQYLPDLDDGEGWA